MTDSAPLIAAAGLVLASHVAPSWPGVREWLGERLGRFGYGLVHSLGSTAALAALILAYGAVDERTMVFIPAEHGALITLCAMPFAFVLVALRLGTPLGEAAAPAAPTGIYRITRAPGALGILIWALAHLQATGDTPRVVIFIVMASIAVFSIVKNGVVLRRAGTPAARRFLNETALVPGWAILRGRSRPSVGEWRRPRTWIAIIAGLVGYGIMLAIHPLIFSIDPLSLIN